MDGFPPPTPGEGAWGRGDNRAWDERLTPSGDQHLFSCVPPRTGVVIHVPPLRGRCKMRSLWTGRMVSFSRTGPPRVSFVLRNLFIDSVLSQEKIFIVFLLLSGINPVSGLSKQC